jgi:hypothetical protein
MTEAFQESPNCIQCKSTLETPVVLGCGHSLCKKYVSQIEKEHSCAECSLDNQLTSNEDFLENTASNHRRDEKFSSHQHQCALDSYQNLRKTFEELELLHSDPYFYIYKAIGELKFQADLIREEIKLKIDQNAQNRIDHLKEQEQDESDGQKESNISEKFLQPAKSRKFINIFNKTAAWTSFARGNESDKIKLIDLDAGKDEFLTKNLMQVDKVSRQFHLKIDLDSGELIRELDEYEKECKSSITSIELEKMATNFNTVRVLLEELDKSFSNDQTTSWEDLKQLCEIKKLELDDQLVECQCNALLNKFNKYELKLHSFSRVDYQTE